MATVGISKPYYAKYSNSGTTITYTGFAALGKAVELSVDLDDNSTNPLYADNAIAESVSVFSGGTLTITTDDLSITAAKDVLGLTSGTGTNEVIFKLDSLAPYVGFGVIVKKIQSGSVKWLAVVFPKVQFSNPGIEAVTQGDTIDWQTPELSATIMRDDSSDGVWQKWNLLDSEADAYAYLQSCLGASQATT